MSKGWCGGHGVPESVCTRCNASLIPEFKEAGDWCTEHGLPESQCKLCNPGVAAKWAALDPSRPATKPDERAVIAPPGSGPETSPVPVDMSKGWCGQHGVPESVCTRCDAAMIPEFKTKNDWCAEHGLPESQCTLCNPKVREKWAARRLQLGPSDEATAVDLKLERVPRLLTATNDPLCQVDTLRVRFLDDSVAKKAGIQTEPVRPRRISAVIDVPAEVEFDATRVTRVTPLAGGVVREVVVQIGDTVKAGDLLAVIDSPVLGEA
ncbi:MAG: efflux RND transporter periplasmic adaptor subunit, partial [Planctomycetota bacterium]